MKLKTVLKNISGVEIKGSKNIEISGITSHSRRVAPGNLFVVKKGSLHDGHQFIEEAIAGGAIAILTDMYDPFYPKLVQLIHPNVPEIEGLLAGNFFKHPSKDLYVCGITGTNGKTTTSYLVKKLLEELNKHTGLIGSIEYLTKKHRYQSTQTTPDVISNQKYLKEILLSGCSATVMEVTSHGLKQGRVRGIDFDCAIFTNLTQDHLDYHKTMDAYAKTKQLLFESLGKDKTAIINIDDPLALDFISVSPKNTLTYGIENEATVRAKEIVIQADQSSFTICYKGEEVPFTWSMIGRFNVYNCLAAISVGLSLAYPLKTVAKTLESFQSVPGRLQAVPNTKGLHIFVDFSHTDDALHNALECLSQLKKNRLFTVFGCGGNRDQNKRPKMAKVAASYSDHVIVTSDNPRNEDPLQICKDIIQGFTKEDSFSVEIDRRKAIAQAIAKAEEGDILLIAGKGHETYQIFSHQTVEFDDYKVASELSNVHALQI